LKRPLGNAGPVHNQLEVPMDNDLNQMTREELMNEVRTLRQGIRGHRDSSLHELCWHHPALWSLLPEKTDPLPQVPAWPEFMRGCIRYRQSLDEQTPSSPRVGIELDDQSSGRHRSPAPTIARIWRGRTRSDRADEYERYNYEVGIKPLIAKAVGVQTLREDGEHDTEFMTISYWESVDAMSRFTGADPTRIHHLDRDAEYLLELPKAVQILKIRSSHGNTGGDIS
jgi:hypothetical protein